MENFMIYHQSHYLEMASSYSLLFISNIARRIMSHSYAIIHRIFITPPWSWRIFNRRIHIITIAYVWSDQGLDKSSPNGKWRVWEDMWFNRPQNWINSPTNPLRVINRREIPIEQKPQIVNTSHNPTSIRANIELWLRNLRPRTMNQYDLTLFWIKFQSISRKKIVFQPNPFYPTFKFFQINGAQLFLYAVEGWYGN
jgi:hypothetical protein